VKTCPGWRETPPWFLPKKGKKETREKAKRKEIKAPNPIQQYQYESEIKVPINKRKGKDQPTILTRDRKIHCKVHRSEPQGPYTAKYQLKFVKQRRQNLWKGQNQ
jgi:hypothetical protein